MERRRDGEKEKKLGYHSVAPSLRFSVPPSLYLSVSLPAHSPSSTGGAKPRRTVCSVTVRGTTNCNR